VVFISATPPRGKTRVPATMENPLSTILDTLPKYPLYRNNDRYN
jgi:hypothetical protein